MTGLPNIRVYMKWFNGVDPTRSYMWRSLTDDDVRAVSYNSVREIGATLGTSRRSDDKGRTRVLSFWLATRSFPTRYLIGAYIFHEYEASVGTLAIFGLIGSGGQPIFVPDSLGVEMLRGNLVMAKQRFRHAEDFETAYTAALKFHEIMRNMFSGPWFARLDRQRELIFSSDSEFWENQ